MDEKTVTMMEGVAREWRVRVLDSAGNVLNPDGFSFYGAAADGVQVPRRMQVRVDGDVVVLVLPGLWMSGRCWRYQVLCQDVLTGVEWVLCQGDVVLERRVACNGPALHDDAVLVDAVLDSEMTKVDVVLGDSTAASAEAARRAAAAREGAETARGDAEKAKDDAVLAKGDAEKAKDDAVLAKGDAEKAKGEAEAAQTKAEQEASKAEQNAALLGDAALKSADNTFTGLNTFAGEVAGVLPWHFHAYSWCKNREQLYAACPDIEQRTVFCADLSSMNEQDGNFLLPQNIKTAVLYFSKEIQGCYSIGKGLQSVIIYAPNATQLNNRIFTGSGKEYTIFAPNGEGLSRFGVGQGKVTVFAICAIRTVTADFCGGHWYQWITKNLIMPFNNVKKLDLPIGGELRNVPYGFPHATYINMNAAKLNKASVMAILNDLKPYDAATMTTAPELSIGIDPTLDGDEEINAALLNAQESVENGGKGWNVAVNGFTVTAGGGATMGLRKPIYAQRRADADGAYIDAAGTRWSVRYGNMVLENWAVNEELGYTEFPNLEAALEEYGLTEYVPEVPEESLTENK